MRYILKDYTQNNINIKEMSSLIKGLSFNSAITIFRKNGPYDKNIKF